MKERKEGYEHRAPIKRVKTISECEREFVKNKINIEFKANKSNCLINIGSLIVTNNASTS